LVNTRVFCCRGKQTDKKLTRKGVGAGPSTIRSDAQKTKKKKKDALGRRQFNPGKGMASGESGKEGWGCYEKREMEKKKAHE